MSVPAQTRCVRFGAFEVDLQAGELRKNGLKIKLQPQPFQVLARLIERPGEMVSREELRRELWPADTFVSFDVGLNNAIKRLREAIGDSADSPRYIETLPRRGYRFVAPITSAPTFDATVTGTAREGVAETAAADFAQQEPKALRWKRVARKVRLAGVAVGLFALVATITWRPWPQRNPATATPVQIHSIAVLPLDNLSGDAGQDYFADGITDALITDLAQISALKVVSRTSVMRYRGSRKPLSEIAKELGVDGIVEGAVIQSGERVRIDAQLIEASTDWHFWAGSYERSLGDVIGLQNEVARAIAAEVQAKLTPQERARLLRTESVDPETYALCLKGRYLWNQREEKAVNKSIEYFKQAIQRSPNYALAYAGLAEAYNVKEDVAPQEYDSAVKAAARRAIELDDGLAEPHSALAASLFWYDWDWAGAEKELQRALELNPNYAPAHQLYGQLQKATGVKNWADEVKRAGELDPLSISNAGGGWYLESGQYDLALELIGKKLEVHPNAPRLYEALGRVYCVKKMYQEAVANLEKSVALSGGEPRSLKTLGYAYAISGKRNEALKIVQKLTSLSKRRYVFPFEIATVYAGLNEKDAAFGWLDKALAERDGHLVFLKTPTMFEMDGLRDDPRYAELIRRVGLPE